MIRTPRVERVNYVDQLFVEKKRSVCSMLCLLNLNPAQIEKYWTSGAQNTPLASTPAKQLADITNTLPGSHAKLASAQKSAVKVPKSALKSAVKADRAQSADQENAEAGANTESALTAPPQAAVGGKKKRQRKAHAYKKRESVKNSAAPSAHAEEDLDDNTSSSRDSSSSQSSSQSDDVSSTESVAVAPADQEMARSATPRASAKKRAAHSLPGTRLANCYVN